MNPPSEELSVPAPTTLARPISFIIPLADLGELSDLPEPRRNEVRVILPLLQRVHELLGGHSLESACKIVAANSRHVQGGLAKESLRRKYNLFRDSADDLFPQGNWRVLVKGYRGPNKQPKEFVNEIKRVAEENRVSVGEALQQLRERWAAGEAIPGYGPLLPDGTRAPGTWLDHYLLRWPQRPMPKVWPRGFYPTGWSPRNLRRYGPARGARTLHARGLFAAKRFFPSVRRDPSTLRPLELIVIDDFELDCLCSFAGDEHHKPQIGRVAGLLAMDVATRRKLHWGLGQRMERHEEAPDGTVRTVRTGISRVDVQLLIHGIFEKFGLPDYPVTLLVENAAAAVSPELQLSIDMLFGGQVRIERTGLIDHRNLTNGFIERGGKPWEKGWIEAAFAKLWNIMGAVRGYKGNNMRLNAPGDIESKIKYTKLLLGQGERKLNLPPEQIAQLRLPFANLAELESAFAWACNVSDQRDNHSYLGFDRVTEYLLEEGGDPQPLHTLALFSPEQQLAMKPVERMETSVERWDKLTRNVAFTPIDRAVLAVYLLTPKRVPYRNNALTFQHNKAYYSYVDREGTVLRDVAEGTEFLCYLNPAAPEQLHITQLNGARTGTLQRLGGKNGLVDIRNKAALQEAAAVQATLINRALAENRALHETANALAGAEREHNDAIVARHEAATAALSLPQRIALAAGEAAARVETEQRAGKALARTVQRATAELTAEDASTFLDKAPAPVAVPAPASEERFSDYS